MVEQELSLVPALTVLENTLLGRVGANFRSRADDRRQVQGLLTRLGLNDVRPDAIVGDLSMAERQLVEIARALSRNARILILDEPTPTLGDREIERVFAGVRELANAGSSVIFVSHRLGEGLDLCSRVIVLRDGRMIKSQPAAEMNRQSIVQLMLGKTREPHGGRRGGPRADRRLRRVGAVLGPGRHSPGLQLRYGRRAHAPPTASFRQSLISAEITPARERVCSNLRRQRHPIIQKRLGERCV